MEVLDEKWARLTLDDGTQWDVSRRQYGPIGIGEAAEMAKAEGCELPTPEQVKLIWEAADIKLNPMPRAFKKWTMAEMSDPKVMESQRQKIEKQLAGRDYKLVTGEGKDVVKGPDGKIGLHGWITPSGHLIQPYFSGHSLSWCDYSQMLRLIKQVL